MTTKILGICGSPIKKGNAEVFLEEALKGAAEISGIKTEIISLAGKKFSGCIHCNYCAIKQKEGDFCSLKDDLSAVYPKMLEADGYLFASPVYITRMTGQLACFFDRMRAIGHGSYYKKRMAGKAAGALSVIWFRNSGAETTLLSIIQAILLFQGYPVTAGMDSAYGAVGFSSLQGESILDKDNPKDKLLVRRDLYGMKMARKIGSNTAELAKILKAGKETLVARGEKISLRGFRNG